MENAMFFWRVLIGSFLVDVIPADIIGVNFSGLALILLTQGVFNLCFLTQLNRIFKRRQKCQKKNWEFGMPI